MTICGRTEITRDLIEARAAAGAAAFYEAEDVILEDFETTHPRVRWIQHGTPQELVCDFVAGCDGYGVSRASVDPDPDRDL